MSEFRDVDIRKLDGGLLLVFRELMRRGQAKEAGARLGLSQPAVSHALTRLRDLFGDPLFIRRPHGLEPTRRAIELAPRIEALIDMAGGAIARGGFDPSQTDRIFMIGGYDSVLAPVTAKLLKTMRREAPRATVRFIDMVYWSATDALQRGEIDLAVGRFGPLPPGLVSQTLFEDCSCVIGRRGHPSIKKGRISQKAYAEAGHVFVLPPARPDGSPWNPAEAARVYGSVPSRNEVATVAYVQRFATALLMVASTDVIASVPRRFAEQYAAKLGLQIAPMPFNFPGFSVDIVRRADHRDPATAWLHQKVLEAAV